MNNFDNIHSENLNKLYEESGERVSNSVNDIANLFMKSKWKKVSFIIPTTPEPSHRPRLSGYRVYVPGAAKNQRFFNNNVLPTLKGLFITTPCKIQSDIYVQTPKSFSKVQKLLAELRILRPWCNTGDIDNYEKAIYDQMQPNEKRGHLGIMSNDCLIIEAHTNKYYSTTPRYEITISYMTEIPFKILKILKLKDEKGDDV